MKKSTGAIPFAGSRLYLTPRACAFFNSDEDEGLSDLDLQKHLAEQRIKGGVMQKMKAASLAPLVKLTAKLQGPQPSA